jgi:hypothetical protein
MFQTKKWLIWLISASILDFWIHLPVLRVRFWTDIQIDMSSYLSICHLLLGPWFTASLMLRKHPIFEPIMFIFPYEWGDEQAYCVPATPSYLVLNTWVPKTAYLIIDSSAHRAFLDQTISYCWLYPIRSLLHSISTDTIVFIIHRLNHPS